MPIVARVLAASLTGAALILAFPPYNIWPLAAIAFAGLVLLLRHRRPDTGALIGFAFGLGFFLPLLHWSGIYVGPVPWILLAVSQTLPVAAFGALASLLSRLAGWPMWTAALWVAQEAFRSRAPFGCAPFGCPGEGGFPWGRLAFSQADSPMLRLASLGGAPLVSFAVAIVGALLAYTAVAGRRRLSSGLAVAVAVLVATSGVFVPLSQPTGRTVRIAIVQGNVPRLGLGFNAQREEVLRNHVAATVKLADEVRARRVPQPDLVVWPENSSDIDPFEDPTAGALIDAAVKAIGVPVLVGAVLDGPGRKLSNVGIVWDPRFGAGQRYVKRHPVPFAEYIPYRSFSRHFSHKVDLVARDFAFGDRPGVLDVGPARVGDVICFEVAYDNIVRDTVTGGAQVIVIQTNNATFGHSAETDQQLAMGQLRAVEHGRSVLVSSTSGISAVITPRGRIAERSRVFTQDLLVGSIVLSNTRTLATRVGAVPEWLLVIVALVAVATRLVIMQRSRRRG